MFVWGVLFFMGLTLWFGYDLPDLQELSELPRQASIVVRDRKGGVIGTYGDLYGQVVDIDKLKPHVIHALLATEDRRFFYHFGIDPIGTFRALFRNARAGGVIQGGSTITQQLARNFFESKKSYSYKDRSIKHKIKEAFLALKIEWLFTKKQILKMYLNRVYMGSGTIGIDAASMRYFGHNAYNLTLYEAAILIGLLKGPSRYSPIVNCELSEERARRVLNVMVEENFITPQEATTAMALPSPLETAPTRRNEGRYFADWVVDHLPEFLDPLKEDIEILTTFDSDIQRIAQKEALKIMLTKGESRKASQVALVSMEKDGAIRAMVGGVNYGQSAFNRATQARRQAGSTFKYFVFLTALEEGYSAGTMVDDRPFYIGDWKAGNYMHHSQGEVSVRYAFAHSVNAVTLRLARDVGIKKIIRMARNLGITTPLPANYSLALGSGEVTLLEMTGAFSAMINEGYKVTPYGVAKILNKHGKVLYQHTPVKQNAVVASEVAERMYSLMEDVIDYGTGRFAKLTSVKGQDLSPAGKTGTSQRYRDIWFIGMVPDLVTGIWVGNDNEKPMIKKDGGWPTLHIWRTFNEKILEYKANPSLPEWQEDVHLAVQSFLTSKTTQQKHEADLNQSSQAELEDASDEDEEDEDEDEDEEEEEEEKEKENKKKGPSSSKQPPSPMTPSGPSNSSPLKHSSPPPSPSVTTEGDTVANDILLDLQKRSRSQKTPPF